MNQKNIKKIRIFGKVMFVIYIIFLFYFLIFSDCYGRVGKMEEYHYNIILFKEIRRFWEYREELGCFAVFTNLVGNILIFIPFGFLISLVSSQRRGLMSVYFSMGLSLCVEVFQFFTKTGSFDVDDLVLNTVGGIFGWIVFLIINNVRRRYHAYGKKEYKSREKN